MNSKLQCKDTKVNVTKINEQLSHDVHKMGNFEHSYNYPR
jgi:hypothetical protein